MKRPKLKKGIYSHFKNPKHLYEVKDICRNTETEEWMVLYKPLYKSDFANLMIRPYTMFFEKVKHPETKKMIQRFKYIKAKR